MTIEARKASLLFRVKQFGGPLNEPAVLAQFLAQVEHESGGYKYVREIWGPTAAQKRYEGRADLGNTQPGDGKRFMGRDLIQVTGRANHRSLTAWVRKEFGAKVDFEAKPELLESPEWLGIGAIWYFIAARKDLIRYCREGNIEMVTRRVNGGLNGYADRLKRYDRIALGMLGYKDVRSLQEAFNLKPDGVSGPLTRAAMHGALLRLSGHVNVSPKSEHVPPVVLTPAQAPSPPPVAPAPAKPAPGLLAALLRALAALFRKGD